MLDDMFPLMKTMHNSEATAPTECQDLMGMSFRTFHFDGAVRAPRYLAWLMDCDMRETYTFHRRVLKLLQWHCPPVLWHLKTPVHMFALDALVEAYPNAKFLWSHRDPAKVMGSVCSLIQYVRSWSSDRNDAEELGAEQVDSWVEGVRRAMDFRARHGRRAIRRRLLRRFANRSGTHPANQLRVAGFDLYRRDLAFGHAMGAGTSPGLTRRHEYDLADYGLTPEGVRERFADYLAAYDATA